MAHRCTEREKFESLRSPVGQAAYSYYSEWMKLKKHTVPPIETFANSRYFNSFMKFAEYSDRTNLPNPRQFIRFMVQHTYGPELWSRDNAYAMYLDQYDATYTPTQQVLESIEFATNLAAEYNCEIQKLFETVPLDVLTSHVQRRKFSPWFLLASKKFREYLLSIQDPFAQKRLEEASGVNVMIPKIQKNQALYQMFGEAVSEIGL